MTYNFDLDLSTKDYELKIDTKNGYGYFEHCILGDESSGGLWFDGNELIDYDGVYDLPLKVKLILDNAGYKEVY